MSENNERLRYLISLLCKEFEHISVLFTSKLTYENAQTLLINCCGCKWANGEQSVYDWPGEHTYLHIDACGILMCSKALDKNTGYIRDYMSSRGIIKSIDFFRAMNKLQNDIALYKSIDGIFSKDKATAIKEKGFVLKRPKI